MWASWWSACWLDGRHGAIFARLLEQPGQSVEKTIFSPDMDLIELAKEVHLGVNRERTRKKLEIVAWNQDLAALAQAHSEDMATNNFFAHLNQRGFSPSSARRVC